MESPNNFLPSSGGVTAECVSLAHPRSCFDVSKIVKLPQFAGHMELGPNDVKSFCNSLETKFPLLVLPGDQEETKKCQMTIACLTGLAQDWWANEALPAIAEGECEPFTTYTQLRSALFARFLPPCANILYRDRLASLRQQNRPVEVYISEFMGLRHKCYDMTDGEALDRFMRGLDFRLRRQLCMLPEGLPTTLKQARERALRLHQAMQGGYFGTASPPQMRRFGNLTSPTATPLTNGQGAIPQRVGVPELMELDNMQARRNNGAFRGKCYECQQYGHRAFECPNKKPGNAPGQ